MLESNNSNGKKALSPHVGVIGANSLVGECLLSLLTEQNRKVTAFSRRPVISSDNGVEWRQLSYVERNSGQPDEQNFKNWICLAPLWVVPDYFTLLETYGIRRIVALSSTSRYTKNESTDLEEQALARRLAEAEQDIREWAEKRGIEWTILRPTLIYDIGRDKNITEIARFIRRFGFFPLFGRAEGLRQPIHAQEVAKTCIAALQSPAAANKAYNISGGETLSYREMVTRIFVALGRNPRLLPVPLFAFRMATAFLRHLPRYRHWSSAMVERMNQDLVFDHSEAIQDLAFNPRAFVLLEEDMTT